MHGVWENPRTKSALCGVSSRVVLQVGRPVRLFSSCRRTHGFAKSLAYCAERWTQLEPRRPWAPPPLRPPSRLSLRSTSSCIAAAVIIRHEPLLWHFWRRRPPRYSWGSDGGRRCRRHVTTFRGRTTAAAEDKEEVRPQASDLGSLPGGHCIASGCRPALPCHWQACLTGCCASSRGVARSSPAPLPSAVGRGRAGTRLRRGPGRHGGQELLQAVSASRAPVRSLPWQLAVGGTARRAVGRQLTGGSTLRHGSTLPPPSSSPYPLKPSFLWSSTSQAPLTLFLTCSLLLPPPPSYLPYRTAGTASAGSTAWPPPCGCLAASSASASR
jgi:hypothetical protein